MKNVHVLPTDKPSRLYSWEELRIGDSVIRPTHLGMFNQYIYITDDSEIKVGDWCLVLSSKKEYLIEKYSFHSDCIIAKKIILTTDPDLIADGVQSIDDEFLEWFVKNQSCESVQVEKVEGRYVDYRGNVHTPISYEIIIPQEEPKQENCCTPEGQIKRYKDCIGCDKKPKQEMAGKAFYESADKVIVVKRQERLKDIELEEVFGSSHCEFSVIENNLVKLYRNQEKILKAIKLLRNDD
jgi:hypothetical protein